MSDSKQVKQRRWWRWPLEILLILLVFFAIQQYRSADLPEGRAPLISGLSLTGQEISLEQYRGQPLLLHFWASWCHICRLEQDSINALAKDYPVLTIASQSGGRQEVAAYMQEHNLDFPVLLDPDGVFTKLYEIRGFPTTFIIDAKGDIADAEVGYTTGLGLKFRLWLNRE
jgi:thiol-disulfide isomerase/thioredoxin